MLTLVLTDAESLTLVLNDALVEVDSFPPALLAELEAPIEAEMLLLKLVLTDAESLADAFATLADADWLALTLVLTDAESLALVLNDALVEVDSFPPALLALIDVEVLSLKDTLAEVLSETEVLSLTEAR